MDIQDPALQVKLWISKVGVWIQPSATPRLSGATNSGGFNSQGLNRQAAALGGSKCGADVWIPKELS